MSQWRDLEPRLGFEDRAWRLIRTAERKPGWVAQFMEWAEWRPATAHCLLATTAMVLMIVVLSMFALSPGLSNQNQWTVVRAGTVTGVYVQWMGDVYQ